MKNAHEAQIRGKEVTPEFMFEMIRDNMSLINHFAVSMLKSRDALRALSDSLYQQHQKDLEEQIQKASQPDLFPGESLSQNKKHKVAKPSDDGQPMGEVSKPVGDV